MILVTIGSSEFQFNRMIRWVDQCLGEIPGFREKVFFQAGVSDYRPRTGTRVGFIGFPEMEKLIREARLVVCHAGVGTVLMSLLNGKNPIVIPRRREYRETVDDHQIVFAEHLAENNLVVYPQSSRELSEALASPPAAGGGERMISGSGENRSRLVGFLSDYLSGLSGGGR